MIKNKIFGLLLVLLMTLSFVPMVSVHADEDTMAKACLNFEFPTEEQKLAVGDYNSLTSTEEVKLDEYVTAFYDSFGCDTNTISFVKYQAAEAATNTESEVHVVFVDDSFHKWKASELMKSTGTAEPISADGEEAERQVFGDNENAVNKTELKALLEQADKIIKNPSEEAKECLEQLKAVYNEGDAVYKNEHATQAEVDAVVAKIKQVFEIEGCVPVTADVSMLPTMLLMSVSGLSALFFGRKRKSLNR